MDEEQPSTLDQVGRRNQAITFHNKAMEVIKTDQQLAWRLLCSAVTVDPDLATGWYMLGNACADLNQLPASCAAFRRALMLPDFPNGDNGDMTTDLRAKCLVNLSHRLQQMGETDEAYAVNMETLAFLEVNPKADLEGRAFAHTNLSQILSIMKRDDEALDEAMEGWKLSQEPIIELGLAFAYLFRGDYAEGLKHFRSRFGYRLPQFFSMPYDEWKDGPGKPNKTLFVVSEQGAGDTLSFTRFIGPAQQHWGKILFQVHPEMYRLMTDSLKHWGKVEVMPLDQTQYPIADSWCSIMSLPTALGLTTQQIIDQPQGWYPKYDRRPNPEWKHKGDNLLHIGIAYGGSPMNGIDIWRSIPVQFFLECYRVPGVRLYSLQVGDRVADLHAAGTASLIRDLSPYIRDVSDTFAILDELDMVLSIESFLPHICGAVEKECWVPLSKRGGDFRVRRHGDKAMWYPKHRLFRQGDDGTWDPVFEEIVKALRDACGDDD